MRLVFIDTGMKGNVDREQAEWLIGQSFDDAQAPKPKVLLTGKPLVVDGKASDNGQIESIVWPVNTTPPIAGVAQYPSHLGTEFRSVEQIISHPDANYVATIGGDVHNYQRYAVTKDSRTIHHLVSGGGGAYLSAIHRFTDEVPKEFSSGRLVTAYPKPPGSVEFYSRAIIKNAPPLSLYALVFWFLGTVAALAVVPAGAFGGDPMRIQLALLATLGTSALALAGFAAKTHRIRKRWEVRGDLAPKDVRGHLAREALLASLASGALAISVAAMWCAEWTRTETTLVIITCLAGVMIAFLTWDQWQDWRAHPSRWSFWLYVLALAPPAAVAGIGAIWWSHPIGIWLIVGAIAATPFSILTVFPERKSQILPGLGGGAAAGMFLLLLLFEWRWAGALFGLGVGVVWGAVSFLSWKFATTNADQGRRHDADGRASQVDPIEPGRLAAARKARWAGLAIALLGLVLAIVAALADGLLRDGDWARACAIWSVVLLFVASAGPLGYLLRVGLVRPSWSGVDPVHVNEERVRAWYESDTPNESPLDRMFSLARKLPNKPLRGPLSDFFSEFFDSDDPPLYKSFLRVDIDPKRVRITAYGVTGHPDDLAVVVDNVDVCLSRDGPG